MPQVKKEPGNEKLMVLKSVVGTLDLNIRYLLQGETFPGVNFFSPGFDTANLSLPQTFLQGNISFHRKGQELLSFVASATQARADTVTSPTSAFPNQPAAKVLQAVC